MNSVIDMEIKLKYTMAHAKKEVEKRIVRISKEERTTSGQGNQIGFLE